MNQQAWTTASMGNSSEKAERAEHDAKILSLSNFEGADAADQKQEANVRRSGEKDGSSVSRRSNLAGNQKRNSSSGEGSRSI